MSNNLPPLPLFSHLRKGRERGRGGMGERRIGEGRIGIGKDG